MVIYRLLREATFNPEQVKRMAEAYEAALQELRIVDRTDPIAELIAKRVIEVARMGHQTADEICDQVLSECVQRASTG